MSGPNDTTTDGNVSAMTLETLFEMEEGRVAAQSLERLKMYSPEQIAHLSQEGAALRERLLNQSCEEWVRKK